MKEKRLEQRLSITRGFSCLYPSRIIRASTGYRYLAEFAESVQDPYGGKYESWAAYRASQPGLDAQSDPFDPSFTDSAVVDFRIGKTGAPDPFAVDAATTNLQGWGPEYWLGTDPRGFTAYDVSSIPNDGDGSINYADIGLYEDVPPASIVDLSSPAPNGMNEVTLLWTATSDDQTTGGRCEIADIRYSQEPIDSETAFGLATQLSGEPAPSDAGLQQLYTASLPYACTQYYFAMKVADKNGNWSTLSNLVTDTTACHTGGCQPLPCEIERPAWTRATVDEGDVDFPLALAAVVPNPSPGVGAVSWSVGRAQTGAEYDLSMFDLAGRRVAVIAGGTATAGVFRRELLFRARSGSMLSNGVFFVRLRVGDVVLTRTVVLAR